MMKNKNLGYVVLGILFVLISVIAFVIPTEKTATFWIVYVFTAMAFVAQIAIWRNALGKEDTLKSKFLDLPVVHVGIVYLVVQIVAFAVFMGFPVIPSWVAVIVCALILGISAIRLISAEVARNEINRAEDKVNQKVFFIRELQADVEMLAQQEQNPETKTALIKLAEKIRYSDPMSSEALADLEAEISEKITTLKTVADKQNMIQEIELLMTERNKKTKMLK